MSDSVALRLGFDTQDIAKGGRVYVETGTQIQSSARQTAQVHKDAMTGMARDQQAALTTAVNQQRVADQQLDAMRQARRSQEISDQQQRLQAAQRANAQMLQEYRSLESAATNAGRAIQTAFALAGVTLGIGQLIRYVDTMKSLEGQLKLVTKGNEDLRKTEDALFEVAQRTRASYEGTVQLYIKVAANAKELGRTAPEMLRFTETVQKAIQVGGSTAGEAAAGVMQLGQALASGVLRGDEFRSVMENMRGLSMTLAQGLGVTVGELRKMAYQGELTAQTVVDAVLKMSTTVDEKFKTIPVTIGQSFAVLQNSVMRYVSEVDEGLGASALLAGGITAVAKNIDTLANAALLFVGVKVAATLREWGAAFASSEMAQLARGNAVLLEGRAAHLARAEAAQQSSRVTIASTNGVITALKAEQLELQKVIIAQEAIRIEAARAAGAAVRVSTGATGPVAAVYGDRQANVNRAAAIEAEAVAIRAKAAAISNLAVVEAQLVGVQATNLAATRASTVANIQRVFALEASTVATIAATAATRVFNATLQFLGGWFGLALNALLIGGMILYNWINGQKAAKQELERHTEEVIRHRIEVDKLLSTNVQKLSDLNAQYAALKTGGLDALEQAKQEAKVRSEGSKMWEKYKDHTNDAAAKALEFNDALKAGQPVAVAHYQQAGLIVSAEEKLENATKKARDAREAAKKVSEDLARQLKNEAEDRKKTVESMQMEFDALRRNAEAASGTALERREAALQARIHTEIVKAHAEANIKDTDAIANQKSGTRAQIAALETAKDSLERVTKAQTELTTSRGDLDLQIRQEQELADALRHSSILADEVRLQQEADAAVRRVTMGMKKEEIALIADELEKMRGKVIMLGHLRQANRDAAQQARTETVSQTFSQDRAEKSVREFSKTALEESQRIGAAFAESILSGGTDAFGKLADQIKLMFTRLIAQLIAMKAGRALFDYIGGGSGMSDSGLPNSIYSPEMNARVASGGQKLGAWGALGVGTFGVGYGIGQQAGGYGSAALGGAASGAAAGAVIGSVVPILGTAVGAVVGAVIGMLGGLLGHSSALKKARQEYHNAEQQFIDSLKVFPSSLAQQFDGIDKAFKMLEEGAKRTKESVAPEAVAAKNKAQAAIRGQFSGDLQAQWNALNGAAGEYANALDAIEKAYTANIETAKILGSSQEDLRRIEDIRTKSIENLKAAQKEAELMDLKSLELRQMAARGQTEELAQRHQQLEIEEAIRAGRSAEFIIMLKETQALEAEAAAKAKATQAAIEAAEAAERSAQMFEALNVRFLRAMGALGAASEAGFLASQRQERQQAVSQNTTADQLAMLDVVQLLERGEFYARQQADAEAEALESILQAMESQLSVAKAQLDETRRAQDALAKFDKDLLLDSNLSPLSPDLQRTEALAQMQETFAKAMGGDAAAGAAFPDIASKFLSISKENYGTTTAYGDDFDIVRDMNKKLNASFAGRASEQQQMVDLLTEQLKVAKEHLQLLKDGNRIAVDTKALVIAELGVSLDKAIAANETVVKRLTDLQTTLTGRGAEVVGEQKEILTDNARVMKALTQAEIDAIKNGASLQQVAALNQARLLQEQKMVTNQGFAEQIRIAGQTLGWDSETVRQLQAQQREYNQGVSETISAILASAGIIVAGIGSALGSVGNHPTTKPGQGSGPPGAGRPRDPVGAGGGWGADGPSSYPVGYYDPSGGYVSDVPPQVYDDPMFGYATGGLAPGGRAFIAGEVGPELIYTGSDARVFNAEETAAVLGGSGKLEEAFVGGQAPEVGILRGIQSDNREIGTSVVNRLDGMERALERMADITLLRERG